MHTILPATLEEFVLKLESGARAQESTFLSSSPSESLETLKSETVQLMYVDCCLRMCNERK